MKILAVLITAVAVLAGCQSTPKTNVLGHTSDNILTKEVVYESEGTKMTGYLAVPKNLTGTAPGILVVHEWWGQNEYPRRRAEMLAELGYVAFAVDMFGNRKIADHPKEAGTFAKNVFKDAKIVGGRFEAAVKAFLKNAPVEEGNIAAIGYCFGGSVVLEAAKQGQPLKGVVSFHGGLQTNTQASPGKVKARILVLNGEADPMVTKENIANFKKEMDAAKVKYAFINYPKAKHAFTNPDATKFGEKFGMPLAYDENADKDSWNRMSSFLVDVFK